MKKPKILNEISQAKKSFAKKKNMAFRKDVNKSLPINFVTNTRGGIRL